MGKKVSGKIRSGLGWLLESMLWGVGAVVVGVIAAYLLSVLGIWKDPWFVIKYIGILFLIV